MSAGAWANGRTERSDVTQQYFTILPRHRNPIWPCGHGVTYDRLRAMLGVDVNSGYIDVWVCLDHYEWIRKLGRR